MARILFADDKIAILDALVDLLKENGHEVRTAPDAVKFFSHIQESGEFDLLILDYSFGRGNPTGVELLATLRKQETRRGKTTPAIIFSCESADVIGAECRMCGINENVVICDKDIRSLLACVDRLVSGTRWEGKHD